ncbi:class I SAM-dependent methyltransferase [Streptomyces sp. HUAS MG47]|uniref:class I SAM-dependent methyltransferase n=1 Tax=Streptomyces solicamelliae TaxID=3231716 RepID=UPI0038779F28
MSEHTAEISAYWDAAAAAFDEEPDHGLRDGRTRAAWAARLLPWVGTREHGGGLDVLDVGCGTGSLSLLLAGAGHRVTGVDLAPRMVEQARAKLRDAGLPARFLAGDAARPPTDAARFDAVVCRHLLWTLPDPAAALREWVARLRPGGRLVLVEGRWREAGEQGVPYVTGAASLPWHGGVTAVELSAAVRPLVSALRIEPLSGEAELWGGPVDDERYALVAEV